MGHLDSVRAAVSARCGKVLLGTRTIIGVYTYVELKRAGCAKQGHVRCRNRVRAVVRRFMVKEVEVTQLGSGSRQKVCAANSMSRF